MRTQRCWRGRQSGDLSEFEPGRPVSHLRERRCLGPQPLYERFDLRPPIECNRTGFDSESGNFIPVAGRSKRSFITAPVSRNGQYVAFASEADNLVANDVNGFRDVFVRI